MPKEIVPLPLTDREYRFCEEYIYDLDAVAAAHRAGFVHPNDEAKSLINRMSIQRHIELLQRRRASRLELNGDDVLKRWWGIVTADVSELTQLRRVNCRYCWGDNNEYQRTRAEMNAALKQYEIESVIAVDAGHKRPAPFDQQGGEGFMQWREPNDTCQECGGIGEEKPYYADTRHLTPSARLLFDGVEYTRQGIKVKHLDRSAALLNVAKHRGMHIDRKEVTGPGGEPLEIVVRVVKPPELIDEANITEAITND